MILKMLCSLFLLFPISTLAAVVGPTYPAPGGNTFAATGNPRTAGGRTMTYSGFNFSAFDQLWWGPSSVQSAMDGAIDSAGETMALDSTVGNIAVWLGSTFINTNSGTLGVDTRFTATITGGGSNWVTPGAVGITDPDPMTVSEITSDPFVVNVLFEAALAGSGSYQPFNTFYDLQPTVASGQALTSFGGSMYYEPPTAVPLPATAWLLLGGLGMLGLSRRMTVHNDTPAA